jgi:hypothetical protein
VTVAELIARLQELPPDLPVYGEADDYWQMPIVAVNVEPARGPGGLPSHGRVPERVVLAVLVTP